MSFNELKFYESYREFEHTYTLPSYDYPLKKVYLVYRDGTIMDAKGKVIKRILRRKKQKNGRIVVETQCCLAGSKFYTFSRVVLAAWDDTFDIHNTDMVVKHRDGKFHNHKPSNLYWEMRKSYVKERVLKDHQVKAIKYLYKHKNTSMQKLAEAYNVSKSVIWKAVNGKYDKEDKNETN